MNRLTAIRGIKRTVFACIAVILFFMIAEIVVRTGGWGLLPIEKVYKDVYDLDLQTLPGAPNPYVTLTEFFNGDGFRGLQLAKERTPGVMRILSAGDSTTQGFRVEVNETYTYLLEKNLRERGVKVEIMNAGVGGTFLWHHVKLLEERLLALKPDLVILYTGPSLRADHYLYLESLKRRITIRPVHRGLARSHLYRLVRRMIKPPHFEDVVSQYFDSKTPNVPDELISRQLKEQLAHLKEICRNADARLLVIPRLSSAAFENARSIGMHAGDPKWHQQLYGDIAAYLLYKPLQELGIPVFSLGDAFLEASYRQNLFADECHFTREGNAFVAVTLADYLCASGILAQKCSGN